tara:strand:+ start:3089 stop:3382 length:294 start_codon:yes stop_codon:yes gene_type:complete
LGWARANLFFDKVEAPPSPGSLQEALCILVQRYRQEQTYYGLLAGLYPQGSKERQGAFDKFRQSSFPYVERGANDHRKRVRDILDRAFLQGPMIVKK